MGDAVASANNARRRLSRFHAIVLTLAVAVASLVLGPDAEGVEGEAADASGSVTADVPAPADLSAAPRLVAEGLSASASMHALGAKAWVGRHGEIEAYLRPAEIVRMAEIGVGVTNPNRAWFVPGGVVDSISWKPDTPGEPYKPEIAAYELVPGRTTSYLQVPSSWPTCLLIPVS